MNELKTFEERCNYLYNKAIDEKDFRLAFEIAINQLHESKKSGCSGKCSGCRNKSKGIKIPIDCILDGDL